MTTTLTLTDFLLARIAADEAVAREGGEAPWVSMETPPWVHVDPAAIREEKWRFGKQGRVAVADHGAHAAHIARHDPARVLAECEAKRRIVAAHVTHPVHAVDSGEYVGDGCSCGYPFPCVTLRALASVYADREGFREEWAL